MLPTTHLLYLHGFRSSPQSAKARLMAERVATQHPNVMWWCPQLPPSPREAMDLVMRGIRDWPRASMAVVGSSLGGFYATCVAERTGCKAVLLNPAVNPARDLAHHIGEQSHWHSPHEKFFFKPEFVDELMRLPPDLLDSPLHIQERAPHLTLLVAATGDEVLDYREMIARHPRAQLKLIQGGDHALSDFADHIDEVMGFLKLD
jgi:uncharacterized protein